MVYEKSYDSLDGYTNSIGNSNVYVYHYDHLGSTRLVTDIDGKTICRFDYGTYGELLTTEYDKTIRYLYNGQLGVITDDNGLYYMRSRYYNPEIKRFINQDILTGSIGNSASLNRYSYVEGNPVSYTDPFGLSPLRAVHDVFHELFYIPVIGHGIAAIDALIYLAEGEYTKAGVSAIYAIPGGTGVGLVIEATAGATAFFLPDDMVKNHDNPIIQDLYEYSHYDEMSKGQIALYTIINGISAYGELKVFNTEPVYEGDYIDFKDPEVRKRFNNNGVKDSDFVNAGESGSESNYILYNKTHKDSLPKPKGTGPNGGRLQSHHGLQQEWCKENLSQYGYDASLAPTVTIETGKGMPHTFITNAQNARRNARVAAGQGKWSSSLQEELSYIVSDFRKAGFSDNTINSVLEQQYHMLDKLGVSYERIKY